MLLAFAGLIYTWRSNKKPWLAWVGFLGLFLYSYFPVTWLFALPLESWYDTNPIPRESGQALVVISG